MAYIGRGIEYGVLETQTFPTNGTANTFALDYPVGSETSLLLVKDGEVLQPVIDYQILNGGTTLLIVGTPLATGVVLFGIFMSMMQVTSTVTDNSITPAKLTSGLQKSVMHERHLITANETMLPNHHYIVNSASAVTVTLPANPTFGQAVKVSKVGTGTVTVGRNGSNINGSATNSSVATRYDTIEYFFVDATVGWIVEG